MSIQNERQLDNARVKLTLLENRLRELAREPATNLRTRELTRQSLRKLFNQLKEEIVRFECHPTALCK